MSSGPFVRSWGALAGRVALAAYLVVSRLPDRLARRILARRLARGKEDARRMGERLGHAGVARPTGRLIWLHGASLGETLSMLPLIEALGRCDPTARILVTSGTLSSAERMAKLLPENGFHQFVPVDTKAAVTRFLDHWRPDLAIWVESEFWPRLIHETAGRAIPMALINARISAASAARWGRLSAMAARLLAPFGLIAPQDDETRERLLALGASPGAMRASGNLKTAIAPPGVAPEVLATARAAVGSRPVWLAASTHPGEEAEVLAAHHLASVALPDLLTILAPRHAERGDEIAGLIGAEGLTLARRAAGELPGSATAIWLADTLGEMGLWLRVAPVVFVGGSLVSMGGHTPFEAAALGAAILHGPETANFRPAYRTLDASGGAREVGSGVALGETLTGLLGPGGAPARAAMRAAAARFRAETTPDVDGLARALLVLMDGGEGADAGA